MDSLPEETLESLRNCVGGLPGKTKAVVDQFYFEGCSIKEVSDILQVKTSAAKVALHRARKAISQCLRGKDDAS